MKKSRLTLKEKHDLKGYLFLLPWILGFLFFFLTPMLQTISFAFSHIEITPQGYQSTFSGLANFRELRADASFPQLLVNSVTDMLISVPVVLMFSFFAASLLKKPFKGIGIVKMIFFMTVILSSDVFLRMQGETGTINSAQVSNAAGGMSLINSLNLGEYLQNIGVSESLVSTITFYADNLFGVICHSGIQIFIFLAGLNSISPSIYEACYMEGASGWEAFWKVTFPMVSPLIIVNVVYTVIDTFGSSLNASLNYINNTAFTKLNFGYASALSLIYFAVIGCILGLIMLVVSKRVFYQT